MQYDCQGFKMNEIVNFGQNTADNSPRIGFTAKSSKRSKSPPSVIYVKNSRARSRLENQSMDEATAKKLFGNLTVNQMALSGIKNALSEYGIPGYSVNSDLRFNFENKSHLIPPNSKLNRFLDTLMKQKEKIPAPDKYNGHKKSFVDNRKMSIYTSDRKW